MPESTPLDFKPIELKADILKTPFKVQTKWHVITGAPSCGKSTLINLLANNGFKIAPEGARIYMESELGKGKTVEEIRSNLTDLQRKIKDIQLEIEQGLSPNECIFLDRAIPDCLAWYRIFGMDPNEFLPECLLFRYASVILLDPLPLKYDGLRYTDTTHQGIFDEWHARDYNALGYHITRVPVMPPDERLAFVVRILDEQGLLQ